MTVWSDAYRDLFGAIHDAPDVAALSAIHGRIRTGGNLSERESSALQLTYFNRMHAATSALPDVAVNTITGALIDYCLQYDTSASSEVPTEIKININRARELLHEWVEQYDENTQSTIIQAVTSKLRPLLESNEGKRACLLFGSIGYRDESLIDALCSLPESRPDMLTYCVDALASCGAASDGKVLALIRRVINSDRPGDALYALNRVSPAVSVPLVEHHLDALVAGADTDMWTHLALAGIARIAAKAEGHEEFHERVWQRALQFRNIVLLDGQIASALNAITVVPELLSLLTDAAFIESESLRVWRIAVRLEECLRPKHVMAWRDSCHGEALDVIRRVATANTGPDREAISMADRAKEFAWQMLIACGDATLVTLLEEAITNEESGWVQEHIMRTVSCIALDDVPRSILELIESEYDCQPHERKAFAQRLGALAIVRASASYRAFQALLNCGYTYDGAVLVEIAEALAEVAQYLHERGDDRVVGALLQKLSDRSRPLQREIAARALEHLASPGLENAGIVSTVLSGIRDNSLPGYARADLVNVLLRLGVMNSPGLCDTIAELVRNVQDDQLLWQCCLFIVRGSQWKQYLVAIWERIGWNGETDCGTSAVRNVDGWRAWIVAEMFLRDTRRFYNAMAHVLGHCNEDTCYQLSRCLDRDAEFPAGIVDIIENRIVANIGPYCSPPYLFKLLVRMEFGRLLSARVLQSQRTWTVEAKVAYLYVVSQAPVVDVVDKARRVAVFDAMAGDSALQVRRAANRAILLVSPDSLIELWRGRVRSPDLQMRLRGAETVEFLPHRIWQGESDDEDLLRLRGDRFRSVRAKCEESLTEAERRHRAESYLERIISLKSGDMNEVVDAFPYGLALAKIGNTETIERLVKHLREHEPPPNVYNWIQRIIKALREKVRDDDKREIGHGWDAIVEHFEGYLILGTSVLDAECHLWRTPQENPAQVGTWGGTIVLRSPLSMRDVFGGMFSREHVIIGAPDRESAKAVVARTKDMRLLVVSGSGEFPTVKPK